jgi:molybdopterin biosynthesis enzyme MoaB
MEILCTKCKALLRPIALIKTEATAKNSEQRTHPLSRACSGVRGQTLILSVPGSKRAAVENLRAILPALPHGLHKLRGDPEDCERIPP